MQKTVLYLHGMGGSPNGRIATALKKAFKGRSYTTSDGVECTVKIVSRLYSFDPDVAHGQITGWVEEYRPDLIVAVSLGSLHALGIHGMPHIYVSPAFNAGNAMSAFAEMGERKPAELKAAQAFIPKANRGVQQLVADIGLLKRYKPLSDAMTSSYDGIVPDKSFGIFGSEDEYRREGIVSTDLWKKILGDSEFVDIPGADHRLSSIDPMEIIYPKALEFLGIAGNI